MGRIASDRSPLETQSIACLLCPAGTENRTQGFGGDEVRVVGACGLAKPALTIALRHMGFEARCYTQDGSPLPLKAKVFCIIANGSSEYERRCLWRLHKEGFGGTIVVVSPGREGILRSLPVGNVIYVAVDQPLRELADLLDRVIGRRPRRGDVSRPSTTLTSREHEVALLAASGKTNKEIAAALSLSPHTVRHRLESVFAKLCARNRTEIAVALSRHSGRYWYVW